MHEVKREALLVALLWFKDTFLGWKMKERNRCG